MTDREYTQADSEADEAAANVMPYSDAFDVWLASEPKGSTLLSPEQRMKRAWQAALARERAKPNEWKGAVIEQLIVSCIYQNKYDDDPIGAINDLIAWETEIALDPKVSCQAQALIDRGAAAERAKQAEPVAFMYQHDETGRTVFLSADEEDKHLGPRFGPGIPLYAAPPADDEAVRLMREARQCVHEEASYEREIEGRGYYCELVSRIDAYLAKKGKL